jgi:beta-lactamase regulating signal transducer with metallopeptidase domain
MTAAALALLALRLTGVVAIASIASIVRKRAAAAEQHVIWIAALAGALLLPFAHFALPEWRIGPAIAGLDIVTPPHSTTSAVHVPREQRPSNAARSRPDDAPALVSPSGGVDGVRSASPAITVLGAALSLWALGTLLCLIRLTRAHAHARHIVLAARPLGTNRCLGVAVPVLETTTSAGPFTYGVLRPSIVMPVDAATWPAERRDAVMTHEAAHALRRDGLALLIAEAACAVYWWHPAVLFAARRAAVACERACDDAVIRGGMRASDYGTQLLAHAQSSCAWGIRPLATTLFWPSHGIAARIAALLDPRLDRRPLARRRVFVVAGLSLGFVGFVAAAAPSAPRSQPHLSSIASSAEPRSPTNSTVADHVPAPVLSAGSPRAPKPRSRSTRAFPPACQQADARYARTLKVDSSLSFTGAGSTRYADGTLLLVWTGVDCTAWLRIRGPVVVDPTWSAITVGSGAEFAAHDDGPGGKRDYVVRPDGSASLSIDGAPMAMGAEHRDWIAMMVLEYVRRTGLDATARARAIVAKGGVPAILDEARKISGKDTRARYLQAAFSSVAPGKRAAFVHDAASLLDSAFVRGFFLLEVSSQWRADTAVLATIYAEAGAIEPDLYVEMILRTAPPPRPLPAALKPLVEKLVASLQSIDRRTALRAYYLDVMP